MRKRILTICALLLTGMLAACGTQQPQGTESAAAAGTESLPETESAAAAESVEETQPAEQTETGAQETVTGQNTDPQTALGEMEALLGMQDEETADLLGGGEENWTEDKSFYIGRNYEVEMGGTVYQVHTSCDDEKIVNSVSIWLSDGERSVQQEEVDQWVQILNEFTGTEPVYDDTSSEVGSKNWKWMADGNIITLNWLDTIFTISMNPAVGELK